MRWVSFILALALVGYFAGGLAVYLSRYRRRRWPLDAEVLRRHASPLLGRFIRHFIFWLLSPLERRLWRLGASPLGLTLGALVLAFLAAYALAQGAFGLGGALYLGAGLLDIFDGRLARHRGQASPAGAFIDSIADRYAELFVLAGLTVYYRNQWQLWLVLGAASGSLLVSYARARGEALGVQVHTGCMQRPERVVYLSTALLLSPLWQAVVPPRHHPPSHPLTTFALALIALLSHFTALARIRHTVRLLRLTPKLNPTVSPPTSPRPSDNPPT